MSLTVKDLVQIKRIITEVVDSAIDHKLDQKFDEKLAPIYGELQALRNDVKEIYTTLGTHQKRLNRTDQRVSRLEVAVYPTVS
jgi:hypothetical protein